MKKFKIKCFEQFHQLNVKFQNYMKSLFILRSENEDFSNLIKDYKLDEHINDRINKDNFYDEKCENKEFCLMKTFKTFFNYIRKKKTIFFTLMILILGYAFFDRNLFSFYFKKNNIL